MQAHLFSYAAHRMTFHVAAGPGAIPGLHAPGPYDIRLGHALLPRAIENLKRAGYVQTSHSEVSDYVRRGIERGIPPIYREKIQAGLRLEDGQGVMLYQSTTPRELYPNYVAIAPLMVETLLFAENRQILEESLPYSNPTVEWERLSRAVLDFGINKFNHGHPVTGASTVATQLEKLRHSPGGRTLTSGDKLRQMLSSSLRSYQDGPENLNARKQIVADYINSLPLAATPSQGEVIGLADGLRAWFGADPFEVNRLLLSPTTRHRPPASSTPVPRPIAKPSPYCSPPSGPPGFWSTIAKPSPAAWTSILFCSSATRSFPGRCVTPPLPHARCSVTSPAKRPARIRKTF
jgi:Transglycosylase